MTEDLRTLKILKEIMKLLKDGKQDQVKAIQGHLTFEGNGRMDIGYKTFRQEIIGCIDLIVEKMKSEVGGGDMVGIGET